MELTKEEIEAYHAAIEARLDKLEAELARAEASAEEEALAVAPLNFL